MTTKELVRTVSQRVVAQMGPGFKVSTDRMQSNFLVSFSMRTTKTRASSTVTRLELLLHDLLKDRRILVGKILASDAPPKRCALATWHIYIEFPVSKLNHRVAKKEARI